MTGIPPAVYRHYLYGTNTMKLYKIVALGGGGGVLNRCLYREAPPRVQPRYPFIYHFSPKTYPFRISSIDKWYPFTYLV